METANIGQGATGMTGPVQQITEAREALELVPGVRQEQILSPQLRASLRVLQMDLPTLFAEVRHEAEVNPVVEIENAEDMPPISDELRSEERREEQLPDTPVEDESNPSVSIDEDAVERRQRFFDRQVASVSLQEHLLLQVGSAGFSADERELAELIVGDIDDDGRYVGSFDELMSVMGVSAAALDAVLRRVQAFDPPGVGGRTLRECLEIQVRQLDVPTDVRQLILRIVDKHLRVVAERNVQKLAQCLRVSEDDCQEAVKILRSLEPKPGRPFLANGKHPQFIRPELEVEMSDAGFSLTSCEHELPTLTISPHYREMADDSQTPKETRRYLRERIGSAELLQVAIRRRGETVLRVAEAIFAEQYDFFARGFESLRPLTIEEIAHRTGYHGTTVGRAVRGKYVRTPRGVFELSRFFCVGHLSGGGSESISAVAVKCRLAALVRAEESNAQTDEELTKRLNEDGLRISRRTVAKYRSELGIPSASERTRRRVS